jgi:hypothetical protein
MSAPTTEHPVIRRRPRGQNGEGRARSFWAPDADWSAALAACNDRGVSLSSQLVRALERIAAGETL